MIVHHVPAGTSTCEICEEPRSVIDMNGDATTTAEEFATCEEPEDDYDPLESFWTHLASEPRPFA